MNAQQAENLRVLIRHMERNVTRTLDMERYVTDCGAPACALGECAVVFGWSETEMGKEHMNAEFFGLEYMDHARLFSPIDTCNAWGRSNVTPKEWAFEAREALARHGYSMDEATPAKRADDGFSAFMAKVQEPLESSVS